MFSDRRRWHRCESNIKKTAERKQLKTVNGTFVSGGAKLHLHTTTVALHDFRVGLSCMPPC
jgi:hypothetical protein